jgi:hypothetical protein
MIDFMLRQEGMADLLVWIGKNEDKLRYMMKTGTSFFKQLGALKLSASFPV